MRKILDYLNLREIGFLEFLVALYPILSGYSYGRIHLALLALLFMDVFAYKKRSYRISYKPIISVVVFCIIHELFLFSYLGFNNTSILVNVIYMWLFCYSIFIITPAICLTKLKGSFNLVAIISIIGLFYHIALINSGGIVSPIKLPFLPTPDQTSRLFEEGVRPVSFFWEPSAFASYLVYPLMLSLIDKKFIWSIILVFCSAMSTSTNGVVFSLVLISVYLLTQDIKKTYKISFVLFGVTLIYFILQADLSMLEYSREKITSTDIQETARTSNGPFLLLEMPIWHIIWGMPANDVFEYLMSGNISGSNLIYNVEEKAVYISAFWYVWAKFGILGFLLYFYSYIKAMFMDKAIIPYIILLLVATFTQCVVFNATYVTQFIFIFCIMHNNNTLQIRTSRR